MTLHSDKTPTGIPIRDCDTCGHRHPITRSHCRRCGLAHLFPCRLASTDTAPKDPS